MVNDFRNPARRDVSDYDRISKVSRSEWRDYGGAVQDDDTQQLEIRGIIFDLDGVVADSHAIHETAWRALVNEQGESRWFPKISEVIRQGRTREEILRVLFPDASGTRRRELGLRKDDLYYENIGSLRSVPGVIDWIKELRWRGFPLAIATSASRARTLHTLQHLHIEYFFDEVVTASEIAVGKPDPGLFLAAAKALTISPGTAMVVEDSEAGLIAAKSAGMHCVLYTSFGSNSSNSALRPDFYIDAFKDECLAPLMRLLDSQRLQRPGAKEQ